MKKRKCLYAVVSSMKDNPDNVFESYFFTDELLGEKDFETLWLRLLKIDKFKVFKVVFIGMVHPSSKSVVMDLLRSPEDKEE